MAGGVDKGHESIYIYSRTLWEKAFEADNHSQRVTA